MLLCFQLIFIDYAFLLEWHYGWRILKGMCVFFSPERQFSACLSIVPCWTEHSGAKCSFKVPFNLVGFSLPKDGFCSLPINFSKQNFRWFLLFMGPELILVFGGLLFSSVLTAFHTSFWRKEPFTADSFLPTQDLVCILCNLKAVLFVS